MVSRYFNSLTSISGENQTWRRLHCCPAVAMQMFNQCARQRSMTKVILQGFTNRDTPGSTRACVQGASCGERAAGGEQIPGYADRRMCRLIWRQMSEKFPTVVSMRAEVSISWSYRRTMLEQLLQLLQSLTLERAENRRTQFSRFLILILLNNRMHLCLK